MGRIDKYKVPKILIAPHPTNPLASLLPHLGHVRHVPISEPKTTLRFAPDWDLDSGAPQLTGR